MSPRAGTAGLVLAGGRSSRMGRDKAHLRIDGETLAERQLRLLRRVGIPEVFLSRPAPAGLAGSDLAGAEPAGMDVEPVDAPGMDPAGVSIVHDAAPGLGPLAGIVAGLERAAPRALLVLAVDMPGVTEDLLEGLLAAADLGEGFGAAPRIGDRWEPLCALYPPGVLAEARQHLAGDRRSPSALLDALFTVGRIRPFLLDAEASAALRSWNAPGDWTTPGDPQGR